MTDQHALAEQFDAHRTHLRAVAYRMLGSVHEADDVVQEAWLRLARSDADEIDNLGGWLTTVVSRICLDILRTRASRPESPLEATEHDAVSTVTPDPEQEAMLADSLGPALIVVLETLAPAERLAFVLHDLFGVPFVEIAAIMGRSDAATRQLASRARRRVRGGDLEDPGSPVDRSRQRQIVEAFLVASRAGEFDRLVALLDPDVVLRADAATVSAGAEAEVLGASSVAATFSGRAKAARLALIDGVPGAVWSAGGQPRVAFTFEVIEDRIVGIAMVADPETLAAFVLEPLDD